MKREEYMNQLRERLEKFGQELQKEILDDYSQHFAEGQAAGRTDEEIIQELGDIEDMIRELRAVEAEAKAERMEEETGGQALAEGEEKLPAETAEAAAFGEESTQSPNGGVYFGNFSGAVLKTGVADIVLTQSEDEAVHVDYQNNGSPEDQQKYEYYQYEKDGIFYAGIRKNKAYGDGKQRSFSIGPTTISFRTDFFNFGERNSKLALFVKLPKKMPEVKLETSSGDVKVKELALERVKCSTASGDVTVRKAVLKKLETMSSSGDLTIAEDTVEKGKFVTASGDILVKESTMISMESNSASGDVTVEGSAVEELKSRAASGDLNIQDSQSRLLDLQSASGDMEVSMEKAVEQVKANTASGDVRLSFRETAGAEVRMDSRSGDLKLSFKGNKMEINRGETYRIGDCSCRVSASTSSGDVSVSL